MAEPLPYPDTGEDTAGAPDREAPPSTPRWVKAFGIAFLVLLLAIAVMMARGHLSGGHGPGQHFSGTGLGGQAVPSIIIERYRPPGGVA
ncbi:MAG TPA: hypothetical protein VFW96_22095 [Thermomicrobiales bacterium]|nr:hypothetical protein [Thermomicrobiales bacterium]